MKCDHSSLPHAPPASTRRFGRKSNEALSPESVSARAGITTAMTNLHARICRGKRRSTSRAAQRHDRRGVRWDDGSTPSKSRASATSGVAGIHRQWACGKRTVFASAVVTVRVCAGVWGAGAHRPLELVVRAAALSTARGCPAPARRSTGNAQTWRVSKINIVKL